MEGQHQEGGGVKDFNWAGIGSLRGCGCAEQALTLQMQTPKYFLVTTPPYTSSIRLVILPSINF
jgi:hypothetical protein